MSKSFAVTATILMTVTILSLIPVPTCAIHYGQDTGLGVAAASFWGEASKDRSGWRVGHAGDVDGDGHMDFLISSVYNDEGGGIPTSSVDGAGQVYVIYGRESGWAKDTNLSTIASTFMGEATGDNLQQAVTAGDVNGDGYDDVLVSAIQNDEGGDTAGKAYLFLGSGTRWGVNTNVTQADASFVGEASEARTGRGLGPVGDINGDGYDDFIIGSYYYNTWQGRAYLFYGKASGWSANVSVATADAIFEGEGGDDACGQSIGPLGDVNGDGLDDFMIGAYRHNGTVGKAYMFFGNEQQWSGTNNVSVADVMFHGEGAQSYIGYSLPTREIGDVNGDGMNDILVSSYSHGEAAAGAGQSYLIMGKTGGWDRNIDLGTVDISFLGENADDNSGQYISGAGDVDGDGFDDFLIGAHLHDTPGTSAGKTYLIQGKASGWANNTDLSTVPVSFLGENANDMAGMVAGPGDVNGDGYDDIVIGAYRNAEGGNDAGQTYLVFPDTNLGPTAITTLRACSDAGYSTEVSIADINDTIYIELTGTDGNASRADIALVDIASDITSPIGFRLRLTETGINTGIYRGRFEIRNRTHDGYDWIGAVDRDNVTVTSVGDPSQNLTIYVNPSIELYDEGDGDFMDEDQPYSRHFFTVGQVGAVTWTVDTNATWLTWNSTTHNITGTPTNGNVTTFWIKVNVSDTIPSFMERTFDLTVNNTPPVLESPGLTIATEDVPFASDYNSSDDGQGTVTYHMDTDAGDWLDIDPLTGNVTGTPANDDVGEYHLNVSVDDGNGGLTYNNASFTVQNVNDGPSITTTDIGPANEDEDFSVLLEVADIDADDIYWWWSMTSDAGDWLSITENGNLSGSPTNDEVGTHWVNVSVRDQGYLNDSHNFTLEVVNVNDPPVIISTPPANATIGELYTYNLTAEDVDAVDTLEYSFVSRPAEMTIDAGSGMIEWTPGEEDEGSVTIRTMVTDGKADVYQNFTIDVTAPGTSRPGSELLTPGPGSTVQVTNPVLSWKVTDTDSAVIYSDVYLGKDRALVEAGSAGSLVLAASTGTNHIASGLDRGATYYWTVIPSDDVSSGICQSGVWSFTVAADAVENKVPVITSTPVTSATVLRPYSYDVDATDGDVNDVLMFSLRQFPTGMDIDPWTGMITWTPTQTQAGSFVIIVEVTDSKVAVTQTFTITVKDMPPPPCGFYPVVTAIASQTGKVGEQFMYQVAATDQDNDPLTYTLDRAPAGMVISQSGLITWTPPEGQDGAHLITVNVSDCSGFVTTQFTLTIAKAGGGGGGGGAGGIADMGILPLLLIALVAAAIIGALAFAATRKKRVEGEQVEAAPVAAVTEKEPVLVIDDIFLIFKDGRLISHHTRKLKPDVDDEVLSGMFTAVQDFIKTGFGEEGGAGVDEISYADSTILIEHGKYLFMSAVVSRRIVGMRELHKNMQNAVHNIEAEYGQVLRNWTGKKSHLKRATYWIKKIIEGEPIDRIEIAAPEPEPEPESPPKLPPPQLPPEPVEAPADEEGAGDVLNDDIDPGEIDEGEDDIDRLLRDL